MKPRHFLPRRTFLRGAIGGSAVALALPALEAMFTSKGALADGSSFGPIFGIFYWANGLPWHALHDQSAGMDPSFNPAVFVDRWTPGPMTTPTYTPSELLAPLATHMPTVITGLEPKTEVPPSPPGQSDGHMRGFMVALTSDRIRPEGFDHQSHTLTALRPSLDQYVSKHDDFYGNYPPRFRSLVVGASTARFHEYGHWNSVSYNGPDSLNPPILDAGQLYDYLFAPPDDAAGLDRRARLLDAVMDDAKSLRARLGAADQHRLDDHLEHLNEIQRRLELSNATCAEVPAKPTSSPDLLDQTSILSSLIALALSCDLTRVFSFMITSPASTHVFGNLGVQNDMHTTCHDGQWQNVYNITMLHMQGFARLLDELVAIADPMGQTLLDRALVYGTSEYGEGWKHGVQEMPVLLAGTAAGKLQSGWHVRERGGNMAKAHVTILRALGIDTPTYGFNGSETSDDFGELWV
jgi:uncharacterized protein DUF1552